MTTQPASRGSLVTGLNHTSFTVTSMDRIIAFFTEGLGFPLMNRSPRDPANMQRVTGVAGAVVEIAFIKAPGHKIELIHYIEAEGRKRHDIRPCDTGFAHIAFNVTDIDAVIEIARKYEFKQIDEPLPVSGGPNMGQFCAYLRDPDGITVEVIGPRVR